VASAVRTAVTACFSRNAAVTSKKSLSTNDEAVLAFEYDDAGRARCIECALCPEIGDIDSERSSTSLSREGNELEVTVEATDLVALRAGLNTWVSLVDVAERAGDAVA
jgi:KEOPS complex subunit Pcc1